MAARASWTDEDLCSVAAVAALSLHENDPIWKPWKTAWCQFMGVISSRAPERIIRGARRRLQVETRKVMAAYQLDGLSATATKGGGR